MLDGPPPPLLPGALDARSLEKIAKALRGLQDAIENPPPASAQPGTEAENTGQTGPEAKYAPPQNGPMEAVVQAMFQSFAQSFQDAGIQAGIAIEDLFSDEDLPPLESGFYLYQDFVLGILLSVLRAA